MIYLRRWEVRGSTGNPYTVSLNSERRWACSCPAWKFHGAPRVDCKHITAIRATLEQRPPRQPQQPQQASRFSGLGVEAGVIGQLPELGARFRHLDLDITVTA